MINRNCGRTTPPSTPPVRYGCTTASNWSNVAVDTTGGPMRAGVSCTRPSPSIPTTFSILAIPSILINPMATSSTPPVRAVAPPQAIGNISPLTHRVMWDIMPQLPLTPTMLSTFPTEQWIDSMDLTNGDTTSSMPPVQAVAPPQAIGTPSPLTQQVTRDISPRWPSIPTMAFTFPTRTIMITQIHDGRYADILFEQLEQPQAIGTVYFR